jgi:hypothetical protein
MNLDLANPLRAHVDDGPNFPKRHGGCDESVITQQYKALSLRELQNFVLEQVPGARGIEV